MMFILQAILIIYFVCIYKLFLSPIINNDFVQTTKGQQKKHVEYITMLESQVVAPHNTNNKPLVDSLTHKLCDPVMW